MLHLHSLLLATSLLIFNNNINFLVHTLFYTLALRSSVMEFELTMYFADDLGVSMRLKYGFLLEVSCAVVVRHGFWDSVTIKTSAALIGLYSTRQATRV